jgi:hypothetical protein
MEFKIHCSLTLISIKLPMAEAMLILFRDRLSNEKIREVPRIIRPSFFVRMRSRSLNKTCCRSRVYTIRIRILGTYLPNFQAM